jgi:hypothetical protein
MLSKTSAFLLSIAGLSCVMAHAQTNVDDKIKEVAKKLHELVADHETDNYDNSAGVHVIENSKLPEMTLAKMSEEMVPLTFESCLYNKDKNTYTAFRQQVNALLAEYGQLEWLTDSEEFADDPSCVFAWRGHTNYEGVEKIHSDADQYGGAGGYFPRCSVVIQTATGPSFLIHAIDTY